MKLTKEDKQLLEQIIKDYTWTKEDEENHKKIMKEIDEEFDEAIKRMLDNKNRPQSSHVPPHTHYNHPFDSKLDYMRFIEYFKAVEKVYTKKILVFLIQCFTIILSSYKATLK